MAPMECYQSESTTAAVGAEVTDAPGEKEAQAKSSRRDVATMLERGKTETARIKVENIINEDIYLELLELLELYCELLIARFGLLDQNTREPDAAVGEGVCAIIHAAPRTEIKELHILRDLLMHKYGRDFSLAVMENRDGCVTERVIKKLVVDMPSAELVDAYLMEIAKGYSLKYTPAAKQNGDNDGDGDDGQGDGGEKQAALEKPIPEGAVAVAPGAQPEDMSALKLPDLPPTEEDDSKKEDRKRAESKSPARSPPPEDDFEALAKRFAALKKR